MRKRGGSRNPGNTPAPLSGPALPIPDKLYFRIGEVARLCRVPAYVLRFWQTEFPQLRPGKSGTGQRLYRRRDVETALRIRSLLYEEGYTIPGAKAVLDTDALPAFLRSGPPEPPVSAPGERNDIANPTKLAHIRIELEAILAALQSTPAPDAGTDRSA